MAASQCSTLLTTLGVQPSLGRAFTAEEDRPGAPKVVVITHGFWERRLGSDPHVLGLTVALNGESYTVQYFERAVFEYHPENAAPNDMLLSQLGTFRYRQKYPAGSGAGAAVTVLTGG